MKQKPRIDRNIVLAMLAVLLTIYVPPANASAAAAYYVDAARCPNTGVGTLANPFCAIQSAVDVSVNGDTIYIRSGAYSTTQVNGKQITFRNYPNESALLQPATEAQFLTVGAGANLSLVNLQIKGWKGSDGGAVVVADGARLSVAGSTFDGNSAEYGGGIYNEGIVDIHATTFMNNNVTNRGGGVYNMIPGKVNITDTIFQNNKAAFGAGVSNVSDMTLARVVIKNNVATYLGGLENAGVYATLSMREMEVFGNEAWVIGGGLYICASKPTSIQNSSIHHNRAGQKGGGIYQCSGAVEMINTTISYNEATNGGDAGQGGGIWNGAPATFLNVTIAYNHAGESGGGLYNTTNSSFQNSILAGNSTTGGNGTNCSGGVVGSGGYNIISDTSCGLAGMGDRYDTDPLLGPLGSYGGMTSTHMLTSGSPAIDTGSPYTCPAVDQRGFSRPRDGDRNGVAVCDRGALESLGEVTFQVNTFADQQDSALGDLKCLTLSGKCSLRAAVQETNRLGASATVLLPAGSYLLTNVGPNEEEALTGDLDILSELTIQPQAGGVVVIDGNQADRVFDLLDGTLSLKNLTIQGGLTTGDGGGVLNKGKLLLNGTTIRDNQAQYGGGVMNQGTLEADNCRLEGNLSKKNGGGLYNSGPATLTNCAVERNTADISGDGIMNHYASIDINGGTISKNEGSGIHNYFGKTKIISALLNENAGVAIYNVASLDELLVEDSSIENNGTFGLYNNTGNAKIFRSFIANNGSDLWYANVHAIGGWVAIRSSTISHDDPMSDSILLFATNGFIDVNNVTLYYAGRISGAVTAYQTGVIQITNSILYSTGAMCFEWDGGSIQSGGYNIENRDFCGLLPIFGDQVNTNPGLGPLKRLKGKPSHYPLLEFSPALNAGSPWEPSENQAGTCEPLDQYRVERHAGTCDVGAVEQWRSVSLPYIAR